MPARPAHIGRYAVTSWAILVVLASLVPPFVYSDQAFQLKALQQSLTAESRSLNEVVTANPSDLTTLSSEWINWWPPSTQLAVFPFARAGLSLGAAIRVIACVALLIGTLGWARWWTLFDVPRAYPLAAAMLLPWERYSSNALFQYSAEALAFASIPWVLIAAARVAGEADSDGEVPASLAFGAGTAAGALYWVKYSSVFVAAGAIVFLAFHLFRTRHGRSRVVWLVAGCALPVAVLSVVNHWFGGAANMLAASHSLRLDPRIPVYVLGNPGIMAADADSMLQFFLTNPDHGQLRDPLAVAALGIPGGLTLVWLFLRVEDRVERLAAVTLAVTSLLMAVVWVASAAVSFEARHVAGAAMAALPAAIAIAHRSWDRFHPLARVWLLVAVMCYVVLPWPVYGPASVATKLRRAWGYVTTSTGFYDPMLSTRHADRALSEAKRACDPQVVVWYIPEPLTSLDFSGPLIAAFADFESLADLSSKRYRGPIAICALLPPKFEINGKGPAIRRSFVDIAQWSRHPAVDAEYDVWVGMPAR
jgi:hypothetical protein